jgi:4-hydroxy-3-polyprenylbenzoate decarboxylase
MWQVLSDAHRKKERVPLTFCFGVPPACTLLAGAAFDYVILPYGCDELGVAGAAQGYPVRLVKARTVDAMAIADSEVVFEGYVDPRDTRYETAEADAAQTQGRFHFHPEWAGYMGKSYKAPTFHAPPSPKPVEPIIYALGAHTLDEHNIDTTIRGCDVRALQSHAPGIIQDVNIPYCMTDWALSSSEAQPIGGRLAAQLHVALLSTSQGMRVVIAVSEDIDIYSMDEVMWGDHHAGKSSHGHSQSDAGGPRPDLHAGRTHDGWRQGVDGHQHPL